VDNGSTMLGLVCHLAFLVSACATVASTVYCLLCIWAGFRYSRWRKTAPSQSGDLPPVSILKPLKGTDSGMYEALRSHCVQEYPHYEIIFGVSSAHDPAVEIVNRLIAEFPQQMIRLVVCEQQLGANGKVSTLAQLVPHASYEFLLVNDSDIRVGPEYLTTLVAELSQHGVGMITCLYRGAAAGTTFSKMEALGISTDFVPGVLAAHQLERGLHFGLGSTLAFRRHELEKIDGFEAIADYLADDYELGRRISDSGLRVELSRAVVETHLPAYDFRAFAEHQARWMRTIRASRPAGYAGLALTFTLPWALATFALKPGGWSGSLLAAAVLARIAMAIISAGVVLRDTEMLRSIWLLPIRDLLTVAFWFVGLFGRKIVWRGQSFRLDHGKLTPS
jgi:ceramide glucosyltransferase